ncbi:MAG TPA: hypothetical protein VEB19_15725 [Gemmatimonadaceae bacterium]|nr:hypothetical protein [Gemmatimonadaceae bacterium]
MTITTWAKFLATSMRRAIVLAAAIAAVAPAQAQSSLQPYSGGMMNHGGHSHGGSGPGQPTLHVSPRWKECSFQLDAALTQAAWRQFTGEAAVVTYFKPLTGAKPMGAGNFDISVVQWKTGIDATDAAWNDTFVHPDSTHWLFEGSGLEFPGLTGRVGLTDRTDVGVFFTKNPAANYGFYGAQLQQNLARESWGKLSAAGRLSVVSMFGPDDLAFSVYGVDLLASREFTVWRGRASIAPYAMLSRSLGRSHEKSAAVDLEDENVFGSTSTVGVEGRLWKATVAAEYGFARVSSFSLRIGVGSL